MAGSFFGGLGFGGGEHDLRLREGSVEDDDPPDLVNEAALDLRGDLLEVDLDSPPQAELDELVPLQGLVEDPQETLRHAGLAELNVGLERVGAAAEEGELGWR
jgi:hypothetical protein